MAKRHMKMCSKKKIVTKFQGNENQNEIPPHTYHGGDYQKDKRQQVLVKDVEKTDLSPTAVRNVS